jgi:hypothetical protein
VAAVAVDARKPKARANSWQARLDKALLDVDATPEARVRSLQRGLRDPQLSKDLRKAARILQKKGMGDGHPEIIETLWPTGTIARADIEGLAALRKQVPETIEELRANGLPRSDSPSASPDVSEVASSILNLLTDTEKQREFQEELKNGFRSTPKGLQTPKYRVLRILKGPLFLGQPEEIEIREYDSVTVVRTDMDGDSDGPGNASAFNALAKYIFGGNEEEMQMAMTVPVETATKTSADGTASSSMAFVLPRGVTPPTPTASDSIEIANVSRRVVAVKAFPGIVTKDETERQRSVLLETIAQEGSFTPLDDEVITLQYNSPLTLPWRRRNELAVVVTLNETVISELESEEKAALEDLDAEYAKRSEKIRRSFQAEREALERLNKETRRTEKSWFDTDVEVPGNDGKDFRLLPSVVSWYDSGIRLNGESQN